MKFKMSQLAVVVCGLLLAGCSSDHPPLAVPSGDYRAMNASRWTATADDLSGPRRPLAPKDSWSLKAEKVLAAGMLTQPPLAAMSVPASAPNTTGGAVGR